MADEVLARFSALVTADPEPFPLDEVLVLIAGQRHPDIDVERERARLDTLAEGVHDATLDGLLGHLFGDLGFAGDHDTYYDARNSILPDVLDRRRGIPITLAAVAMEVGRRSGVVLEGIGMPGHFLVRSESEPDRYVDVFDGGREITADGCRDLFERLASGVPWSDDYLRPSSARDIVARVLANLAGAHRRAGDRAGVCWALDLRLRLPGATDQERRELGLLLGASGRFDEGAAVLERSSVERDLEAAARLRARLN